MHTLNTSVISSDSVTVCVQSTDLSAISVCYILSFVCALYQSLSQFVIGQKDVLLTIHLLRRVWL